MAKYTHTYGGVGAPVGLTVFKTAGGSLGAVPGGFDSHTPLTFFALSNLCACHYTHRFWRFPKPMLPICPPKLCFPSLYRKNVFYYCATFIRGHRRYQKE